MLPTTRYPSVKPLSEIVASQMGESFDPDGYLRREASPTPKDLQSRDANLKVQVDGSLN